MNRRILSILLLGTVVGVLLVFVSVLFNLSGTLTTGSYFRLGVLISVLSVTGSLLTISRYVPTLYKVLRRPRSFVSLDFELLDRLVFWEFWAPIVENEEMVVVYPNREKLPEAPARITYDVKGVISLITGLTTYFKKVEYDTIDDRGFSSPHTERNIVCVGGPIANDISYQMLYNTGVPIKFHKGEEIRKMMDLSEERDITQEDFENNEIKDMIISETDEDVQYEVEKYPDSTPEEPKVEHDWGIVTRIPSPYDSDRIALNVAGVFAPGTYAGFEILTSPEYLEEINESGYEFFQLVYRVSVDRNGIIKSPEIVDLVSLDDIYR